MEAEANVQLDKYYRVYSDNKEVVELLNGDFRSAFEKEVKPADVSSWTKNYEINAVKGEDSRWKYREIDVRDFVYRYQYDRLHKFNSTYDVRTRCRVPRILLRDFILEESTFQKIVCILVTLDPYALFNDPERNYDDLGFAEGGINFKDATVTFYGYCASPKDAELGFRQQRLLYPVLVAETINHLAAKYSSDTEGASIKEKILTAGWTLVNGRISYDEYLQEIENDNNFCGWRGSFFRFSQLNHRF